MCDPEHKACYGKMFPSTLGPADDRPSRGKVFAYQVFTAGGMFRSGHRVDHDLAEWEDCLGCAEFESCYRLGLGQVLLEAAIGRK